MSDTQIKTLEDFQEERALEWGYKSWNDMMHSGIVISNKVFEELEVHKRFHLYQLECNYKEIAELKQMVVNESKEFQKIARELKDGYDKLISDKVKEVEHIKNENAEFWNKMHKSSNELNHAKKEIEELKKEIERLKKSNELSNCEHTPSTYYKKYATCTKCGKLLQMKP